MSCGVFRPMRTALIASFGIAFSSQPNPRLLLSRPTRLGRRDVCFIQGVRRPRLASQQKRIPLGGVNIILGVIEAPMPEIRVERLTTADIRLARSLFAAMARVFET